MNEHPDVKRLRERAEGLGWDPPEPSEREIEERIVETERRKEQLQEAWRRRRTGPAPSDGRPDDKRSGRRR